MGVGPSSSTPPKVRVALDDLPDAVLVVDDDRRYVEVNEAACALLGRTRDELLHMRVEDVVAPDSMDLERRWSSLLQHGSSQGTVVVRHADGRSRIVSVRTRANVGQGLHVAVLRDAGSPPPPAPLPLGDATLDENVVGVDTLTELLNLHEDLLASDAGLRAIMRRICDRAAAVTGADGAAIELVEGDDIVYATATGTLRANEGFRFRKAGSLSGTAIEMRRVLRCDDTENEPRVDRDATRRAGLRSVIVVPLFHEDQVIGVLEVGATRPSAFDRRSGELLRLVADSLAAAMARAAADDARRAFAEKEKQRVAELERLRQEMTTLVVHDLKSPLSVLLTNLEVLRDELPAASVDALSDAVTSARRLESLISTLLDTARMESGHLVLAREPVRLKPFVQEILDDRAVSARARKIDLANDVDESAVVDADASLLRRLADNVIDNAFRYTPRGGRVRVTTSEEPGRTPPMRVLRIGNSGPAIPEEQRARLFDKFAQLEGATATNVGLGLYFCKLAAAAHGGRIWIESSADLPCVFAIALPSG